jgi:ATP-dependent RNA helicase DHX29
MAKKKKTQLKPVARGFATVSVTKKVVPGETEAEIAVPPPAEGQSTPEPTDTASQLLTGGSQDGSHSDQAEERSLQNFIDKYQDRVEKEIVRTLKVHSQQFSSNS